MRAWWLWRKDKTIPMLARRARRDALLTRSRREQATPEPEMGFAGPVRLIAVLAVLAVVVIVGVVLW